jgi:hypothetical protein
MRTLQQRRQQLAASGGCGDLASKTHECPRAHGGPYPRARGKRQEVALHKLEGLLAARPWQSRCARPQPLPSARAAPGTRTPHKLKTRTAAATRRRWRVPRCHGRHRGAAGGGCAPVVPLAPASAASCSIGSSIASRKCGTSCLASLSRYLRSSRMYSEHCLVLTKVVATPVLPGEGRRGRAGWGKGLRAPRGGEPGRLRQAGSLAAAEAAPPAAGTVPTTGGQQERGDTRCAHKLARCDLTARLVLHVDTIRQIWRAGAGNAARGGWAGAEWPCVSGRCCSPQRPVRPILCT